MQGFAIQCWRCSSDDPKAASFCHENLNETLITDEQRRWSYVDCRPPPGFFGKVFNDFNSRITCEKKIQMGEWLCFPNRTKRICTKFSIFPLVDDKVVVSRGCKFAADGESIKDCPDESAQANAKTTFCKRCSTNGCNGVDMNDLMDGSNNKENN